MLGPGEYGREAEKLAHKLRAEAILLLVISGKRGSSFSVAVDSEVEYASTLERMLPELLRKMADEIENSTNPQKSTE